MQWLGYLYAIALLCVPVCGLVESIRDYRRRRQIAEEQPQAEEDD